jgi:hypothetical protein
MTSLQDKLVHWLMVEKEWSAKGHITRIVWKDDRGVPYLPETVGRALRSAEESSRLAVKYDGKNTLYKWLPYERRDSYIPTSSRTTDALFR